MKKYDSLIIFAIIIILNACQTSEQSSWDDDFYHQPIKNRPALEVCYSDSSRSEFHILAQDYQLKGLLETPHLLTDFDGKKWLSFSFEEHDGERYRSDLSPHKSRINLYRRGPYFCEIHWLDIQLFSARGDSLPLKGDLMLFCYPEKILAEIKWYSTSTVNEGTLIAEGINPVEFEFKPMADSSMQSFAFPLFGEEEPLPNESFVMLEGKTPMHYVKRKGYYSIGSVTSGNFSKEFYETPNKYETVRFRVKNNDQPRKIYVCHESVVGGSIVEGGMVLNEQGLTMPIVVQVSKNFDGEKEEKFYNPKDTSFSETFFPLYLEPNEEQQLTSYHLYQNWGRHMTKHWSSLGAWMDYFHSSTGVTETTCYVPFKFAGIGGVAIADFRAMSQPCYWNGQPQHDNLAGHSFLSFYDGKNWIHSKYVSTIYRSTGPNWFDIQLNYISADSSIKISADIWETPQSDELRSFFKVKYEVLKPLIINDASANFRFLSVTSRIQNLKFTGIGASGLADKEIDYSQSPFPIKRHQLPNENAYLAIFGDSIRNRGSNAIVVRSFNGPDEIGPAMTLQTGPYNNRFKMDRKDDTRLLLVPDQDDLVLKAGDVFEIDGYWLPYGTRDGADIPRREIALYGNNVPKVKCKTGELLSSLPVKIKAKNNKAEFSIVGGKDYIPIIINGLNRWDYPRIWKKEGNDWRLLGHSRNDNHDGYQVFCEEDGSFGAVFLVHCDHNEQVLKVTVGKEINPGEPITLSNPASIEHGRAVALNLPGEDAPIVLSYPIAHGSSFSSADENLAWKSSEGNSLWFELKHDEWMQGGRVTPNQTDIDLEYWWQNLKEGIMHSPPKFKISTTGTSFEDKNGQRNCWMLQNQEWVALDSDRNSLIPGDGVIAIQSFQHNKILCLAWPNAIGVINSEEELGIALKPIEFGLNKRYHLRGKVFIIEGDLETLKDRISKETPISLSWK